MTNVTTGTERILRHHMSVPTPCVVGDLEQLIGMFSTQGPQSDYMDRANVIADDTAVHITWDEVLDKDWQSPLDRFQVWLRDNALGAPDDIAFVLQKIEQFKAQRR